MRVHEYAKKIKISSKDLLNKLASGGFDVASHMSVLSSEAEEYLNKEFNKAKNVVSTKSTELQKKGTKIIDSKKVIEKQVPKKEIILEELEDEEVLKTPVSSKIIPLKREKIFSPKTPTVLSKNKFEKNRFNEKVLPRVVTEINIKGSLSLNEVANLMNKSAGDLIYVLLKKGIVCNINSILSEDTIKILAQEFNITVVTPQEKDFIAEIEKRFEKNKTGQIRWPIVVVMGHVDHGKTTLLDFLRKKNVAAKEKGGITQHLGAYEVDSTHGKMVFLDTPGHEAFSYMRQKGARITDIAILVVAADDGVKPQTIEAIKHAKEAGVPIIVAINKIDKPGAKSGIESIKRQLAQHDLVTEDWGGQTICVPISAKTGEGVEELLEMITLQSEIMELKAESDLPARAFILESKMEKGFGPVATVIVVQGTLRQGDFFICGSGSGTGKIRLLVDSFGKKITQAGPSTPVKIVGFDSFVSLGDWLQVIDRQEYLKAKSSGISKGKIQDSSLDVSEVSLTEQGPLVGKCLNIIIKTDTQGSREAIVNSLAKLSKQKKDMHYPIRIISTGIGDITEGDILSAADTHSLILGLHVKPEKNAFILAKEKNIDLKIFDVIYHMIEELEKLLLSKKEAVITWKKTGELEVRKVFDIKKVGVIAGCYVRDGIITRNSKVECIRYGKKMGEGKITSLQKEKKTVKEVHSGHECGFVSESFHDWQVGDTVNVYTAIKEIQGEA
ncbi:MAG: translation initiation factor IF-2 [bacterium]